MSKDLGRIDASNWKEYRELLLALRHDISGFGVLGQLLEMAKRIAANGLGFASERLADIGSSYIMLCDYMLKGYKDDRRAELYANLLRRTDRVMGDMQMALVCRYDAAVSPYLSVANQQELNIDDLRSKLEAFVSDSALLSLEPEDRQKADTKELYEKRQSNLQKSFNIIVASPQWSSQVSADMQQLLLSPTIDSVDVLTLLSAIMLSALLVPDAWKVSTLMGIYMKTTDTRIRERALVGWVFALNSFFCKIGSLKIYPEVDKQLSAMLDEAKVCEDLLQLQMQVYYCMNAEHDNETIRKDVMPSIIKNQSIEISRFGIREKEDDPMEDILRPDEADKKMEEMEKSMRKMVDMQKQGADIYFGGFSKMKRFSFFYTLSNWFTPFYKQHPQLGQLSQDMLNAGFMDKILEYGPFCDSDKYSFAIGLSSVFSRLPQNVKEMLSTGEASMQVMGMSPDANPESPLLIRRQYLQDLYRFFRINDSRKAFFNPFENINSDTFGDHDHLFFYHLASRGALSVEVRRLAKFLLKHKLLVDLSTLLLSFYDDSRYDDVMLKAQIETAWGNYDEAEGLFAKALDMKPDSVPAMKGYASACFHNGLYAEAAEEYHKLLVLQPDRLLYKLNLAISLINAHEEEGGVKVLYELYYMHPDDLNVKRALAWGQLCLKHLDQAEKLYEEILASGEKAAADYLNAGYCKWFGNDLKGAVALFKQYMKAINNQKNDDQYIGFIAKLSEDKALLDSYNITDVDRRIVAGMV